ncbi:MAG: PspC domain-containing protein [Tissierellia bacterium]|nr:PspC domain-containing protein [Tissierellia bacterium]
MKKRLTRSSSDRYIAGVCGGVAEYLGIDSTIVRLIWIIFGPAGGLGVALYILAALVIPAED